MPTARNLPVKKLKLDLHNHRMVEQSSESGAVENMIALADDRFWALIESIADSGYLPTENIIVQEVGREYLVREGNRRIAALKLLHGYMPIDDISPPRHIAEKAASLTSEWKKANTDVPCAIFTVAEEKTVDKIVSLAHAKSEKAGRDPWQQVARARHNRDKQSGSEPALDLLESFLRHTRSLATTTRERWGGAYPLSVLLDAIKKVAPRLGFVSSRELAAAYPKVKHRADLDRLITDIGHGQVSHTYTRSASRDFLADYGFPDASTSTAGRGDATKGAAAAATAAGSAKKKAKATYATNDPRSVTQLLRGFSPRGPHREKLVTLIKEAKSLDLAVTPHAFAFVVRAILEISVKAYCKQHSIATTNGKGYELELADLVQTVFAHLSGKGSDKAMQKWLHGAVTELKKKDSLLSVTSLNALVHSRAFVADGVGVSTIFNNVFPLLQAMNGETP